MLERRPPSVSKVPSVDDLHDLAGLWFHDMALRVHDGVTEVVMVPNVLDDDLIRKCIADDHVAVKGHIVIHRLLGHPGGDRVGNDHHVLSEGGNGKDRYEGGGEKLFMSVLLRVK